MIPTKLYEEGPLLQDAAGGSQQAFTELFYKYKDRLYSFLIRLTESPEIAEDVIQDTFLKLWKNRTEQLADNHYLGAHFDGDVASRRSMASPRSPFS